MLEQFENAPPVGICVSDLIDAVVVMKKIGTLNKRVRIQASENVNVSYFKPKRLYRLKNYRIIRLGPNYWNLHFEITAKTCIFMCTYK